MFYKQKGHSARSGGQYRCGLRGVKGGGKLRGKLRGIKETFEAWLPITITDGTRWNTMTRRRGMNPVEAKSIFIQCGDPTEFEPLEIEASQLLINLESFTDMTPAQFTSIVDDIKSEISAKQFSILNWTNDQSQKLYHEYFETYINNGPVEKWFFQTIFFHK